MADDPVFVLAMPIGPDPAGHPLLEAALRSVAAQTEPLRLAVLDASGSNAVAEALDRRSDLISFRRTGPDTGQAAAIQEGWDALDGDVYGWLNADDLLYPDTLSRAADMFASDPGLGAITGQSLFFDHGRADAGAAPELRFKGLHPEAATPGHRLTRTNTVSQPSTFVRRDALDAVGGLNADLQYTMDWDLWVRLWGRGTRFGFDPEPLSAVYMQAGTKTSEFGPRRRKEIGALVNRYEGPVSAAKSMVAFWLTHRADASGPASTAETVRDRMRGRGATLGPRGGSTWPLIHYGDRVFTTVRVEATGPLHIRFAGRDPMAVSPGETLACDVPPGRIVDVESSPMTSSAGLTALVLGGQDPER